MATPTSNASFYAASSPNTFNAVPIFVLATGRFISAFDEEHARSVVVIGRSLAESLFPNRDPIGKQVQLNGRLYEVIGTFAPDEGLFSALGVDQFACIPLSNFRNNYPKIHERFISVEGRTDFSLATIKGQVDDALRRKRHVPHNAEDDFDISSPDFFLSLWDQLTGALVLLTGIISGVGLLVGGIGVMNIMLISVTERTSEIGVRKAVGARRSDIRIQFLLEAIMLSCIGGVIGIVMGALIAFLVRTLIPAVPAFVSPLWIGLGFSISVGVGLFFGYYPANRAANLDPIVCLRYE